MRMFRFFTFVLLFIIGSFYPSGEPTSQHLHCYEAFAVKDDEIQIWLVLTKDF
jgi:hypothetical protein